MIQPVDFKTFKGISLMEKREGGRVHYALFDTYCILSVATGAGNFVYECVVLKSEISEIELIGVIDGGIPTVGRILNVPDRNEETLKDIKDLLNSQKQAITFTHSEEVVAGKSK